MPLLWQLMFQSHKRNYGHKCYARWHKKNNSWAAGEHSAAWNSGIIKAEKHARQQNVAGMKSKVTSESGILTDFVQGPTGTDCVCIWLGSAMSPLHTGFVTLCYMC